MSKKKVYSILAIVGILAGIGRIGRAAYRAQQLHEQQAQKEQVIQQAKAVQEYEVQSDNTPAEKNQVTAGNIMKNLGETAAKEKFDTYTPVEESYGLGQRDGNYYIWQTAHQTETLLQGVDLAYVLDIDDQDQKQALKGIFARQNNE